MNFKILGKTIKIEVLKHKAELELKEETSVFKPKPVYKYFTVIDGYLSRSLNVAYKDMGKVIRIKDDYNGVYEEVPYSRKTVEQLERNGFQGVDVSSNGSVRDKWYTVRGLDKLNVAYKLK